MTVIAAVVAPPGVPGERVHDNNSRVAMSSATPKAIALKISHGFKKKRITFPSSNRILSSN
jgi:hypothetical protein